MGFTWYVGGKPRDYALEHADLKNRQVDPIDRIDRVSPKDQQSSHQRSETQESPARQAIEAYQNKSDTPRERQPAILVQQIMTAPVQSLAPSDTLLEAWRLFSDKLFRHIPVLDQERKLVGMISDRDILKVLAGLSNDSDETTPLNLKKSTVENSMRQEVLSAQPDTTIREVARTMFEERLGAMPVVDEKQDLIGIVTRSDILRTVMTRAPLELWI